MPALKCARSPSPVIINDQPPYILTKSSTIVPQDGTYKAKEKTTYSPIIETLVLNYNSSF